MASTNAAIADILQNPTEPTSPPRQKPTPADGKQSKASASGTAGSTKKEKKSAAAGGAATADGSNSVEAGKEKAKEGKESKKSKDDMTIDDLLLPRTLISRLSRGSLPPNTSLQKDALLALTKSATVFISYLAHTANNLTSRKTIQADDILKAITEMELDSVMRDRLEREIKLFEEGVRGKRKGYRDRVKARESGVSQLDGTEIDEATGDHVHKRLKRSDGGEDVDMGGLSDAARTGGQPSSSSTLPRRASGNDEADDDEDDDPSAQLLAEASRAARHEDADETEDEADLPDDEDEDDGAVDNEEEDDDEDDEEENENNDDDDDDNEEGGKFQIGKKSRHILAPDGRAEVGGSDDESD